MRTILLRCQINTELVSDSFVVPIRQKDACIKWLLAETLRKYHNWHPFKVYEFEIDKMNNSEIDLDMNGETKILKLLNISEDEFESNTVKQPLMCTMIESQKSKLQRKEDEEKAEEMRLERLRIEAQKKEKRRKRIDEISLRGNCWELENYSQFLNVPLYAAADGNDGNGGQVVVNTGSLDQWCSIRFISAILPSFNKFYFSIKVVSLPHTTNSWRICIGAVPIAFKVEADRHWIGSQHSWSYISGTGGKCHNSGKSVAYGDPYGEDDVISMLLNFDNQRIEFFKNGKPQGKAGVAFKDLKAAVIPAVSLTAKGCKLKILDFLDERYLPPKYRPFMVKNVEIIRNHIKQRQHYLSNTFESKMSSAWNRKEDEYKVNMFYPRFSSYRQPPSLHFQSTNIKCGPYDDVESCNIVTNNGSGDKWRVARSFGAYYPNEKSSKEDADVCAFQFRILNDFKSSNTWRICCGVVPIDFDSSSDKIWVGAQSSWSYISGTGGKCHATSQSTSYGERYSSGDSITILLDFGENSIEFFKNGESQGIAFTNCEAMQSGCYGAVSFTAAQTSVKFISLSIKQARQLQQRGQRSRLLLESITSKYGNVWDKHKMSRKGLSIDQMDVICSWNKKEKDSHKIVHCAIASKLGYQTGRRYFEIQICSSLSSANGKWKMCIGVVPKTFNFNHSKNKNWIGAQNSWGLILGTGGKCHNSSKSVSYTNETFGENDIVGVLMDFDNHTMEFYKNGQGLGEAFNNLYGPVLAACSIACNHCKIRFRPQAEEEKRDELFLFH